MALAEEVFRDKLNVLNVCGFLLVLLGVNWYTYAQLPRRSPLGGHGHGGGGGGAGHRAAHAGRFDVERFDADGAHSAPYRGQGTSYSCADADGDSRMGGLSSGVEAAGGGETVVIGGQLWRS